MPCRVVQNASGLKHQHLVRGLSMADLIGKTGHLVHKKIMHELCKATRQQRHRLKGTESKEKME